MLPLTSAKDSSRQAGDASLRRLAANLAHNVNNSLAGVIGYLELALREAPAGTHIHEHLQQSLNCSHRIAEMIRRVVAFAFHPAGHGELAAVSLRQLAEHVARSVREEEGGGETKVTVQLDSEGLIQSNRILLLLVLDQLTNNALDAMTSGGELALRVWEDGSRRCLSITDTGRGMGGDVLAHVFEPFFTTKHSGHLGLGLAMSRDVIEALGGIIQVSSVEGLGTTVTLSFPASEQTRLEDLPIDERIGTLLPIRLSRHAGPHFACPPPVPAAC